MGSSKIRKALGAVKDQTSIGIAKVSNSSAASDIDVAIVKATRHDEYPAEEKHIREILSLTCYSRAYISACVSTISRRLGKTRSWAVALKTLVLVHRLLAEGDPAYEQEIFFATRRGTRMLNMSEFRDTSRSDAWDFSAFVRTYALYLDERLDYRMHGRRVRRRSKSLCEEEEGEETAREMKTTPVREMKTERLFVRVQHLQQLLDRFLACRPTGAAKNNRIVAVALYPLVKESYQIYFDLQEIMSIFIDRFMELEVPDCVRTYDVFTRLAKQFEELDIFYSWCKTAGVSRPSEFPEIERIVPKKLQLMDDFIRDKSALSHSRNLKSMDDEPPLPIEDSDLNSIKALPAPETSVDSPPATDDQVIAIEEVKETAEEVDFLNMRGDQAVSLDEHADKLALALFDGEATTPTWEAFTEDAADWETALVLSASNLTGQKPVLGGGLDKMLLDGMYSDPRNERGGQNMSGGAGSASSVVTAAPTALLALPAPATTGGDPFAASVGVPAPAYVQMSEMEKKQRLLVEEQMMWQQYARDGMQGEAGMARLQNGGYPMSGYNRMF